MKSVLSTKKLSPSQTEFLLNAGLSLVQYDAIKIEFVPFEAPSEVKNAIITSQNAVRSIQNSEFRIQNCFCVGGKTKALLEENGFRVIKMAEYASELADYLVKNHQNDSFHFFCGNIRSDEIPTRLKENNIALREIEVYKTTLNPKKFERQFDAILFFSPSGVKSFVANNSPLEGGVGGCLTVCIGTTTASEAKKHTENVAIANATSVESVIAKAVKMLL